MQYASLRQLGSADMFIANAMKSRTIKSIYGLMREVISNEETN